MVLETDLGPKGLEQHLQAGKTAFTSDLTCFQKVGVGPQNGWFIIMEKPIKNG